MHCIESGRFRTDGLPTQTHKSCPDALSPKDGKFSKSILTYLYCIKNNEINVCHSNIIKSYNIF